MFVFSIHLCIYLYSPLYLFVFTNLCIYLYSPTTEEGHNAGKGHYKLQKVFLPLRISLLGQNFPNIGRKTTWNLLGTIVDKVDSVDNF